MPGLRLDWIMKHGEPPVNDAHVAIAAKYKEAQAQFRRGDWDAMVIIEDDMIIPPDTFPRLISLVTEHDAEIGYGLYVWRHGRHRWNAYLELNAIGGISYSRDIDRCRRDWGRVVDVAGVGMGCTIIGKEAMHDLEFRRGGLADADWYMALDAQHAGIVQKCDLGLVCGHMDMEPSPRILWPDPAQDGSTGEEGVRVVFLPEDASVGEQPCTPVH